MDWDVDVAKCWERNGNVCENREFLGVLLAGVDVACHVRPLETAADLPCYSNGIPSGWQGSALHPHRLRRGSSELLESGWSFVLEDIGSEWVMTMECPEFARGGDGRRGGVKALPMHRDLSPCPGGIRGGLEHDEHPRGLRRGVSTADGGLVGLRRMPEWEWGFVSEVVRVESVMPRDCPAFARGGEVLDMFTRLRPNRAKKRVGRFTQGAARGLALPWANEWLRLWRAERIGSLRCGRGRRSGVTGQKKGRNWRPNSFHKILEASD